MKKTSLLLMFLLAITLSSQTQIRPRGAVLLGGSLAVDQVDSKLWRCQGSMIAGWFPINNLAIGTDLIYWSVFNKYTDTGVTISPMVFTRYHLPFFNPIFAQVGIGGTIGNSTYSLNEMSWYSRLGYDFDIGKMVILELSISRYQGFHSGPAEFTSNLGFLILLNAKSK